VQLALLRHPGMGLAQMEEPIDALVEWLAARLGIPASAFADYAGRPQTMTDHALMLAATLGLRAPGNADLPLMIEAAAQSAWGTDRGAPIVAGVAAALRAAKIILPASAVIERTAIAGRARARKRAADALLAGLSPAQLAKLDALLIPNQALDATPLAWLRNAPTAAKPDHVRSLLDRLRRIREIGVPTEVAGRIHEDRFRQLIREGANIRRASDCPLCRAATAGHARRFCHRSRSPPDRHGARHGGQVDRRLVHARPQGARAALCCWNAECRPPYAAVP
jgi:hypothetical protein